MKTVEKDPAGGWIARNPRTGEVILGDDFRWNSRESARGAVWDAQHFRSPADAGQTLYVTCHQCDNCQHIGINDEHATESACNRGLCGWHGPTPTEDVCPGCGEHGTMSSACPKCGGHYMLLAEARLPHGVMASGEASAWWALVMCAAASIEDAANCLRDPDAKKQAEGAAKHYREAAQKLMAASGVTVGGGDHA